MVFTRIVQMFVTVLTKRLNFQQKEEIQTQTRQRSVSKSSKRICVNFDFKGLLYGFLLRIGLLLNVGHMAIKKPCTTSKGFKTIFCFLEE